MSVTSTTSTQVSAFSGVLPIPGCTLPATTLTALPSLGTPHIMSLDAGIREEKKLPANGAVSESGSSCCASKFCCGSNPDVQKFKKTEALIKSIWEHLIIKKKKLDDTAIEKGLQMFQAIEECKIIVMQKIAEREESRSFEMQMIQWGSQVQSIARCIQNVAETYSGSNNRMGDLYAWTHFVQSKRSKSLHLSS